MHLVNFLENLSINGSKLAFQIIFQLNLTSILTS